MIENIAVESALIDENLKKDLTGIFSKLTEDVILKAVINMETEKGRELAGFLAVMASLNEHIHMEAYTPEENAVPEINCNYLPVVGLYKGGKYSGISFHGVPGGQEINSFVLAIYNLAGPGQEVGYFLKKKIQKIDKKVNIKICVSLACHHCPKVVAACQRMASLNENIEAEMIDANLYPELVEEYKIERVPLIIVNDKNVFIGPKTIEEMTEIVKTI